MSIYKIIGLIFYVEGLSSRELTGLPDKLFDVSSGRIVSSSILLIRAKDQLWQAVQAYSSKFEMAWAYTLFQYECDLSLLVPLQFEIANDYYRLLSHQTLARIRLQEMNLCIWWLQGRRVSPFRPVLSKLLHTDTYQMHQLISPSSVLGWESVDDAWCSAAKPNVLCQGHSKCFAPRCAPGWGIPDFQISGFVDNSGFWKIHWWYSAELAPSHHRLLIVVHQFQHHETCKSYDASWWCILSSGYGLWTWITLSMPVADYLGQLQIWLNLTPTCPIIYSCRNTSNAFSTSGCAHSCDLSPISFWRGRIAWATSHCQLKSQTVPTSLAMLQTQAVRIPLGLESKGFGQRDAHFLAIEEYRAIPAKEASSNMEPVLLPFSIYNSW